MRMAVIGGGAAGCFCAVNAARRLPEAEITLFEAGPKLLAKVAVTGGGRCNITNSFQDVALNGQEPGKRRLAEVYPRGDQLMRRALRVFGPEDTLRWFEAEGVRFVVQEDQCVFPESQDAMQIVRTLERCLRQAGVRVRCNAPIGRVGVLEDGGFTVEILRQAQDDKGQAQEDRFDRVVVCVGGSAQQKLMQLLPEDIDVTPCVPSLYTLKIPDGGLRALMGTVVERAALSLAGTRFRAEGTLLLTDWGVSGPATLRLSSYAARHLAKNGYAGTLLVNWLADTEARAREWVAATAGANPRKQAAGTPPEGLTARLWRHVLQRAGLREDLRWAELGGKGAARLAATLTADAYPIAGRARFKEEFVTCGGVSLNAVDIGTLESKAHPGLFFAGEALDVDAVTGGFNLQAAWSTGFVVAAGLAR